MKPNPGDASRPVPQCLAISVMGKSKTHHRCRLPARHAGEHVCVVNGCHAGWRS